MAGSLYRKILYFKIRPFEFLVSMPALKCECMRGKQELLMIKL